MIVGVDIGTGSLKAVVTDTTLEVRGKASRGYDTRYPRPGWAEQSPGVWEAALGPTIRAALDDASVKPEQVRALGLAGQLDGCVGADRFGNAVTQCLIWVDKRADSDMGDVPAQLVLHRNGVVADPSHMAAKIRWLKRNHDKADDIATFHQPVSYLVSRLTGAQVLDHGHASTTMVYDLHERRFDPGLLDAFGLSDAELPRLAEAYERAGELNPHGAELAGLPAGTPVAVGTGDDFSNPLGAGLVEPGRMACCIGTAEVTGALHDVAAVDHRALMQTLGYPTGAYFIENPGWLSGGALAWFVETFGIVDFATLDALASEAPPGADGVLFLPALGGATAPEWVASARGCFYGLTPSHGRAHMARALLEGCAFAMRDICERLREMDVATDTILLLGGGARSELWGQIRADLTGIPVEVPAHIDTSPIGAAMLASVAAGLQPNLAAAADLLGSEKRRQEPRGANRPRYDDAYGHYRLLFESLKPMYDVSGAQA